MVLGRREEAQAIVNFNRVVVLDLAVRVTRNDLEEIPLGWDRSRGQTTELSAVDLLLRPLVVCPVDSDGETACAPGCPYRELDSQESWSVLRWHFGEWRGASWPCCRAVPP